MATQKKKSTAPKKKPVKKATAPKKAVSKKVVKKVVKKTAPARKVSAARATTARKPAASKRRTTPTAKKAARSAFPPPPPINRYEPATIEPKWQARWAKDQLYRSVIDTSKPKHYALTMLPYPSGNLHIGHWYAMTPSDARARWMRMRGYNVLFPMGFDAFGLPAENAAIKDGVHPMKRTYANIAYMRQQMQAMGTMFDWEREAVSSDPAYYKWTEWFFLQLFKHDLAYKKLSPVDWCPNCNTTLAREQVWGEDRHCERCGTPVIKKNLDQWYFRTTKYADELLNFVGIDWPEKIRDMQTNWIGRSEGAEVQFAVSSEQSDDSITVFTTRPDTLWGATFMVLAPEHPLVAKLTTPERQAEVEAYVAQATRQTDIDRESTEKEKTGVFIGAYAINPVSDERIPIWIADYVLMTYGTGAIMAVPSGDQRDFEFARKYGLKIIPVVQPEGESFDGETMTEAYDGAGVMINSGPLNGMVSNGEKGRQNPAIDAAIAYIESRGAGKEAITYRLRDWLISRQRYWGSPIPMVYCPTDGIVPVPENQLPITLPEDVEWLPTGQSPLKLHPTWKNTTCPKCGGPAERDTDTMDTFMCSSWYHLRYLSPKEGTAPFAQDEYDYWMPVDTYTGGAEHATMHLIYTRFFHKALRDMGMAEGHEPMMQLRNQGQILGPDGQRMSKSRGNVIDPDEQVRLYGADVVRTFMMFGFQWSEGGPWSTDNIQGVVRWLNRVWNIVVETADGGRRVAVNGQPSTINEGEARVLRRITHQTIQKVSKDFDEFEFNTVVSALMELTNALYKYRETTKGGAAWEEAVRVLLLLSAPVAPHITEELWERLGQPYSIHQQAWPVADPAIAAEDVMTIVVQINGKVRDRVTVPAETADEAVKAAALASEGAQKYMDGKPPRNVVYVKGRLVNIVV